MVVFIIRHFPIILGLLVLAGCATPVRAPDPTPPREVPASTWRQVDCDIVAESLAATGASRNFAHQRMTLWRQRVTQQAEVDFIPWFTGYWTQQWLTVRVAWYRLNASEASEPPVNRLATYLQAQYHERVLAPVAEEVDPATVGAQATEHYLRQLGGQLQPMPERYGIPRAQFEQHLKAIPAIALAPPPAHDASLYQLLASQPLAGLPAYAALLGQVSASGGYADAGLNRKQISPVALRISENLLDRLAIGSGAGAAATLIGGVAGTALSLGTVGFGVMLHDAQREGSENQLRGTLNGAVDDMWHSLMDDPKNGVMAGIYYLADRIEQSCPPTFTHALSLEDPPRGIPLADPQLGPAEILEGRSLAEPDPTGQQAASGGADPPPVNAILRESFSPAAR
jgi:hypothetical protein